jgi:hypothetical protein
MSITDEIFSQCTIYNVHIEAMSGQKQTLRDEINITNQTPECFLTEELVLVVGFTLLGILIMCAVGMACYYKKKSPLYNISRWMMLLITLLLQSFLTNLLLRFRYQLYSRLYSQERYQNPIRKAEFNDLMAIKMKEPAPFSTEFDRLEKLSCDTIERKTCMAELPSSRRRNR